MFDLALSLSQSLPSPDKISVSCRHIAVSFSWNLFSTMHVVMGWWLGKLAVTFHFVRVQSIWSVFRRCTLKKILSHSTSTEFRAKVACYRCLLSLKRFPASLMFSQKPASACACMPAPLVPVWALRVVIVIGIYVLKGWPNSSWLMQRLLL